MENSFDNVITASGNKADINRLKSLVLKNNSIVDFQIIKPIPDELSQRCHEIQDYSEFYDYLQREWGTKCNAIETQIDAYEDKEKGIDIFIDFTSKDTPPKAWFEKLCMAVKNENLESINIELGFTNKDNWCGGFIKYSNKTGCSEREADDEDICAAYGLDYKGHDPWAK